MAQAGGGIDSRSKYRKTIRFEAREFRPALPLPVALGRPPLQAQPAKITELDYPGGDVSRNAELMIENCCLVHFFFLPIRPKCRVL